MARDFIHHKKDPQEIKKLQVWRTGKYFQILHSNINSFGLLLVISKIPIGFTKTKQRIFLSILSQKINIFHPVFTHYQMVKLLVKVISIVIRNFKLKFNLLSNEFLLKYDANLEEKILLIQRFNQRLGLYTIIFIHTLRCYVIQGT